MEKIKKFKLAKIFLILILLLYSIVSFYKLGNMKNPQTFVHLKNDEQLTYKIDSDQIPYKVMIYSGSNESYMSVFFTNEYQNYDEYVYDQPIEILYDSVFKWNDRTINLEGKQYSYIMFQSYYDTTVIGEIKLYDIDGKEIPITAMEEKGNILLDEQDLVPKVSTYMNSTYFDEVYFPRTAYEQLNNLPIYEYTHPPLGKLLISIPVYFFGVTPFAYRIGGNIAGILMILIIYLIAKELFKKERYALFAAAIMALDGMHFVQTRIGTVDSYLVFFCLTSFLFFLKYIKISSNESLKKKMIPLLLSGTFWGMAMSTKWTAAYIGLGMGIIYFVKFIVDRKMDVKLLIWSVLSFVIVPIIIYVACYIPIINNPNHELTYTYQYFIKDDELTYFDESSIDSVVEEDGVTTVVYKVKITDVKSFLEYQKIMYTYHSRLEDGHTYSSKWFEWPIMKRPLWYNITRYDDGKIGTIACMGNPAIWYIGMLTTALTLIYVLIKKEKEAFILIIMILTTWLPYALIKRTMFIYHFFVTIPFVMLTIPYIISKLASWKKHFDMVIPILLIVFLGFFIYFYPVYSGMPVEKERIIKTEWMETWEYDGLTKEMRDMIKEGF